MQNNFHANKEFYEEVKVINNDLFGQKNSIIYIYISFFFQELGLQAEMIVVQPGLEKAVWRYLKEKRKRDLCVCVCWGEEMFKVYFTIYYKAELIL